MEKLLSKLPKLNWPHPLAAAATVVALFIISQLVAYIIVGILMALGGNPTGDGQVLFGSSILAQFAYILVAEGFILGVVAFILRQLGIQPKDLGLSKPKWADPLFAALGFVVYITGYVLLVTAATRLIPGLDIDQKQDIGFDGASGVVPLVLVFLALVVLAPVTEEILMRGFLFGSLRHRLSFWVSTIITSIIFAALHLGGGEQGAGLLWIAGVDTFVLSVVLCYLREKTGRLWASIVLHAIKNGIAFTALFIINT